MSLRMRPVTLSMSKSAETSDETSSSIVPLADENSSTSPERMAARKRIVPLVLEKSPLRTPVPPTSMSPLVDVASMAPVARGRSMSPLTVFRRSVSTMPSTRMSPLMDSTVSEEGESATTMSPLSVSMAIEPCTPAMSTSPLRVWISRRLPAGTSTSTSRSS